MPYYGFNPYMQQYQQPQQTNFVHVQNEMQAREWAIALNSSITFIDDNQPYFYTKSMGVSQFEPPVFKRYRIVEDIAPENVQNAPQVPSEPLGDNLPEYITKAEFEPPKTGGFLVEARGIEPLLHIYLLSAIIRFQGDL